MIVMMMMMMIIIIIIGRKCVYCSVPTEYLNVI